MINYKEFGSWKNTENKTVLMSECLGLGEIKQLYNKGYYLQSYDNKKLTFEDVSFMSVSGSICGNKGG